MYYGMSWLCVWLDSVYLWCVCVLCT